MELAKLLSEKELKDATLLILANKQVYLLPYLSLLDIGEVGSNKKWLFTLLFVLLILSEKLWVRYKRKAPPGDHEQYFKKHLSL